MLRRPAGRAWPRGATRRRRRARPPRSPGCGGEHFSAEQEAAAVRAVRQWTTVLTGGPGTGKTTTVARLLVLLADQARGSRRPTVGRAGRAHRQGRDPARRRPCCGELDAGSTRPTATWCGRPDALTLHRLLGWRPDNSDPVPPRPRQPAQVRPRRRRRVLDGRADHDGPAARGGPARGPAGARRRPAPAHLGRRRGGAGRPRRAASTATRPRRWRPSPRTSAPPRTSSPSPAPCATATPTGSLEVLRRGGVRGGVRRDRRPGVRAARRRPRLRARGPRRRPSAATPRRRWPPSTGTGCCARTARVPTASGTGTARSSAGSPRRPGSRSTASGTSAGRCWSPPTTTRWSVYNGETGAVVLGCRRAAARLGGRLRAAARLRTRPARRGRDHARDDHPQEPGQPGRAGHGAAPRRGLAAADPRALLHRGDPRPGARAGRRLRGGGARGRRPAGAAGLGPGRPAARRAPRCLDVVKRNGGETRGG